MRRSDRIPDHAGQVALAHEDTAAPAAEPGPDSVEAYASGIGNQAFAQQVARSGWEPDQRGDGAATEYLEAPSYASSDVSPLGVRALGGRGEESVYNPQLEGDPRLNEPSDAVETETPPSPSRNVAGEAQASVHETLPPDPDDPVATGEVDAGGNVPERFGHSPHEPAESEEPGRTPSSSPGGWEPSTAADDPGSSYLEAPSYADPEDVRDPGDAHEPLAPTPGDPVAAGDVALPSGGDVPVTVGQAPEGLIPTEVSDSE